MINSSLDSREDYVKMKKSIMIAIVNGKMFPDTKLLHTSFHYREDTEHFSLSDKAELHFIELSKVDPAKPVEEMDPVEQFAAYVKYAGDPSNESLLHELIEHGGEAITMTEKIFKELTDEEKAYWRRQSIEMKERDDLSRLADARREGASIGEANASRRIACNLKAKDLTLEEIMDLTGLTAKELEELQLIAPVKLQPRNYNQQFKTLHPSSEHISQRTRCRVSLFVQSI